MVRKHRAGLLPITVNTEYEEFTPGYPYHGRRHILERLCCSLVDSQLIVVLVLVAIVALIALVVIACLVLGRMLYVNWNPETAQLHSKWKMESTPSTMNQQLPQQKAEYKYQTVNNQRRYSNRDVSQLHVNSGAVT